MWQAAALAACAIALALGWALRRSRRAHRTALEEQRRLLERERGNATRAAVDTERARIARELHDIVSHNVSLMVVQSSAAQEVLETMPEEAATAMRAVEEAGRSALTELRHLLGVLAPSSGGEDETNLVPQPGLDRLDSLIDRFAFAGLPVEVLVSGEARGLPAGVDVTAYRIVQEALTNALKHGKGARAQVMVRYTERWLRVEVLNTGSSVLTGHRPEPAAPEADTGRGLLGLKERVAVYGGELDARRRLGGGFRVRARIPLDPA
ncbi:MAG TPA: histidine kinase [Glycomyces sp.]|nr:histidine kinase [Glycomyces sp.]